MGRVMFVFQIAPFAVVAVLAVAAVLSHQFRDNLLQRVGLSGICLGAALSAYVMWRGEPPATNTFVLLAYGVAVYGVGTFLKVRQHT